MTRPLLVLRPAPGNAETVARAGALGLEAIAVPLFEVVACAWNPPDAAGFDALMVTSANTVRHAGPELMRYAALPAYAVGAATADALRRTGFAEVHTGPGDAVGLIDRLRRDGVRRVLHPCGAERRAPEAGALAITRVVVYAAHLIADPPGLAAALARAPVAMLHSPRAAARFASLVPERGAIAIAAISRNAADAAGEGWESIAVAEAPNDNALLAIAARMCKQGHAKTRDAPQ